MTSSTHALSHCPLHRLTTTKLSSPSPLLKLHCSMPRPPNRFRRKPRKRSWLNIPSNLSSSSYTFSSTSSDSKLQTTIDLDCIYYYQSRVENFLVSGIDAYRDLQTLITFDPIDRRLAISCRRSTMRFMGNLVVIGCVIVLGFRVLVGVLRFVFKGRSGIGNYETVVRRDRSLGGKEVVVAVERKVKGDFDSRKGYGGLRDPLSLEKQELVGDSKGFLKNWIRGQKKLPKWWPSLVPNRSFVVDKQEYQREANMLVRAITDNRLSGKDIVEDDIIQLRQICRTSGVQVSFATENTRDTFYRVSVDFVLNVCGRAPSSCSIIQIDGEDVREFIAGLAENIGLENVRAVRIVSGAVAAQTRSRFLQAWALEMQGEHAEAISELSKICLVLRIFPPEEYSPEMEMVARSLEKHLKVEQRQDLMNMLVGVCGEESRRTVAEALGLVSLGMPDLMPLSTGVDNQN